jgi:hypothetical protein
LIPHPINFLKRTKFVEKRCDTNDWTWTRDMNSIDVNSLENDKIVHILIVDDVDTQYCNFVAATKLIKKIFPNCVFEWLTIYHNHRENEK